MSNLKVIHFIWSANFGGIEKMAIELAHEQNKNKLIKSELLIGCKKGEFLELIQIYDIPVHFGKLTSGLDFSILKLIKIIRLFKMYDFIHLHTFNLLISIAAIISNKKIVYSIHGNFNYGKKIRVTDRINNALKKYFLNYQTDLITFNSNWCRSEAIRKFTLRTVKQKVIYNGLYNSQQNSNNKNVNFPGIENLENNFVIGTVARFNKSKRIDRLITVFSEFSKNKPDAFLLLTGDGAERDVLEKQITNLNLEKSTIITGFQNNIKACISKMDICIFPFENEAFGLVLLEAFSMGKPAIVYTDSGGIKELMKDEFPENIVTSDEEMIERMEYYYKLYKNDSMPDGKIEFAISESLKIDKMSTEFLNSYNELYK